MKAHNHNFTHYTKCKRTYTAGYHTKKKHIHSYEIVAFIASVISNNLTTSFFVGHPV